jgi:PKD repeat protein
MTDPIFAYSHQPLGCNAITGGAFVPDGIWPSTYDGGYLYGDYTCGQIFLLQPNGSGGYTSSPFATGLGAVVDLGFGPTASGQALYYTDYGAGEIRRITFTGTTNRSPTAAVTATPTAGPLPLAVSFDGTGSSDPDGDAITYIWNFGDGSAPVQNTTGRVSHTYSTAGTFTATLTVKDSKGASSTPAGVRVDPGDNPPQVTIDTPAASDLFSVGQTLVLHATATDAEDGQLPASALSWRVLRHHDTHTHPYLPPTTGNDVQVVGPEPEDLLGATNSYLEVYVTATDSRGVSTTVERNVMPRKVSLTFATQPSGLHLQLDATDVTAPATVTSWVGWNLPVNAPSQVDGSGKSWQWASWSDGGAASHTIATPASAATYTATFQAGPSGLVAAYGFDEGSGTAAADSSGKGNSGVVSGATWTTGHSGGALAFDGSSDWVTVADSASLDLTSGMTLEAWVRPSALGASWRSVLFKEQGGGMVYSLYANDGSQPRTQVNIGGEKNAVGTSGLPVNAWTHLAGTYDGTTLRLYVNGTLVTSTTVGGSIPTSTGPLRIGGDSIWPEWFAGSIDDVRVYNRPLSASEIQTDMATPVGGSASSPPPPPPPPPPPTGLVAQYTFDAGSGTTVADGSGNANTGTVDGATWTTSGHSGAALTFDGSGSSVSIPDSSSLTLSSGMTLEAWVRPTALGESWRTVLFKEKTDGTVYSLYANDGSLPRTQVNIGGEKNAIGTGTLPLDTWTHLAGTYDGTTLRLYVNGALVSSTTVGGAIPSSTGPLRIGGNSIWPEWFAGTIDSVRVYNRALSQSQIQADMNAG